jgi:GT2 family glycosyltransferase
MCRSTPRVSILLPNLNHRPFLEERLQSILDQTFRDWELIIVDNHSDDGAWEFFKSLPERDPRIRIFQAPRRGMYDNWNNCIRLAKGEYLYIATSDDTMTTDFLERMIRALDENRECDLAHCKLRIIDENGEPSTILDWNLFFCTKFFQDWIDRAHIRRAPFDGILHCGVRTVYTSITQLLIRKRLFDRVGLFSIRFGSAADFEWGMRASLLAHTVHVPHCLATWRVHGRQGTDLRRLDAPEQKRKLIQMVRHAFHAARRIDPAQLRNLRLSDLTYFYRKERLYVTIREAQRRRAPKPLSLPRKIAIGLVWLCRDPQVFLEFHRQRKTMRQFLQPLSPLQYPRELLEKYGFMNHLVPAQSQKPQEGS